MPITRTTWTDDDGSGTTGSIIDNAWLQTLYNQIDAFGGPAAGAAPTYGSVGLTDISTAGLGSLGIAFWMKIDKLVVLNCYIAWPATASGLNAWIGGLPFTSDSGINSGLFQCSGAVPASWFISAGTTQILLYNPTNGSPRTNVQMSGTGQTVLGFYRIP